MHGTAMVYFLPKYNATGIWIVAAKINSISAVLDICGWYVTVCTNEYKSTLVDTSNNMDAAVVIAQKVP